MSDSCDPIDSSPSSSPIPGILQARTLEWVETCTINFFLLYLACEKLFKTSMLHCVSQRLLKLRAFFIDIKHERRNSFWHFWSSMNSDFVADSVSLKLFPEPQTKLKAWDWKFGGTITLMVHPDLFFPLSLPHLPTFLGVRHGQPLNVFQRNVSRSAMCLARPTP